MMRVRRQPRRVKRLGPPVTLKGKRRGKRRQRRKEDTPDEPMENESDRAVVHPSESDRAVVHPSTWPQAVRARDQG